MKRFSIIPEIICFDTFDEYKNEYPITDETVVFSGGTLCKKLKHHFKNAAYIVDFGNLPKGEPTDLMVESIYSQIKDIEYSHIIAIGGGTVLDTAKLFALKEVHPVVDLFQKKLPIIKDKKLTLIPATCGTGSEVTNISILELTAINSKFGLAADELYADEAILIPELLSKLPFKFFATSSVDALIHSIESFTSPKSNEFTRLFSQKAMKMILEGYINIIEEGQESYTKHAGDFLTASCFAGIAFGNAGCAAVHAMSYPLGAKYHIPHGEANYALLTAVYKRYMEIDSSGSIKSLNIILSDILNCDEYEVYERLEELLDKLIQKKSLSSYGMTEEEIPEFSDIVIQKQSRLMTNNYVPLDRNDVIEIYKSTFS